MTTLNVFPDRGALAAALAGAVADSLRQRIARDGAASLAVSGGRTPERFFEALGGIDLDWSKVTVTLVDERWVDETSDRSNAALVRRALLAGRASAATFVPLYNGAATPDEGRDAVERTIAALPHPFAAVILGMGDDGHTASFFPGGDHLAAAVDLDNPARVTTMHAGGAGEARITLTLAELLRTDHLALHIEGDGKKAVLEKAQGDGPILDMPIRAALCQSVRPITIYWSP
ncbi:6-phosphogluconolactonase [Rhizobiales bacterium Sp-1]|uniref:6-phosphogluconolactonase n=2 Tax=Segnochrobactrum spirostomi TaxID=2608987 RepID=A0A6A7XY81_9HYPH|nr:6-phosphogluconolactonase [Segnochrobactrum spirostomi]MQT11415.1 6-phosphogluconolactonase [Segnochrobactrum spirostomi]